MKSSKYNFVQVYNIWVNGRCIDDIDQHFPINTNIEREWHNDFKQAYKDFFNAKNLEGNVDDFGKPFYQDYIVTLYSIDIDVEKFEKMFDLKFNLEDDDVQEMIPYYEDYKFNTVVERICKFKRKYDTTLHS